MTRYDFTAELWLHDGDAAWHFVTVPHGVSDDIEARSADVPRGFGSVRVRVTVGQTTWSTSVFPDKNREAYVLPMKKDVRRAEHLTAGDDVTIALALVDAESDRVRDDSRRRRTLAGARGQLAPAKMTFRLLTDDDLPLLHRWLNDPAVVRWWEGDDVSWPSVVADYGSGRPDDGVELYLANLDDEPIGWIQCYPAASSPEETEPWFPLGVDQHAAGIDYLIGDNAPRGRGLGSTMIAEFVQEVVFRTHPEWTQAAASPFEANVASCRALVKAGFRFAGTFADPDGPCALHVIDRPESGQSTP